jgi:hypothetical protein
MVNLDTANPNPATGNPAMASQATGNPAMGNPVMANPANLVMANPANLVMANPDTGSPPLNPPPSQLPLHPRARSRFRVRMTPHAASTAATCKRNGARRPA